MVSRPAHAKATSALVANLDRLPLAFEPNLGQTDPKVKFIARSAQYEVFLTGTGAVFSMGSMNTLVGPRRGFQPRLETRATAVALQVQLLGANPSAEITPHDLAEGYSNYAAGRNPRHWLQRVPHYGRVDYAHVYPGVDVSYYGRQSRLEFDFVVAPGASTKEIVLGIKGADAVRTAANGDLIMASAAGDVVLHKPVAYQKNGARRDPVESSFVLNQRNEVAFAVGPYDPTRQLIIDPSVSYSTFLGASGKDYGLSIAVESTGAAYVTGQTFSTDFPHTAGKFSGGSGLSDAFVTKFKADGSTLVYSTFLGGKGNDSGNAITLDANHNAYIVGSTESDETSFPLTGNAAQSTFGGVRDAFVAVLNSAGSLTYATFAGGSDEDVGEAVAIDGSGNIYAGGETKSSDFPLSTSALQANFGGKEDGFLTKISAAGARTYSSYLGGSSGDLITGVGLDNTGNVYVSGITISTDFPVRGSNPYQTQCGTDGNCNPGANGAQDDSFLAAFKSDFSTYIYSTYFGGSGADDAQGLAVDGAGDVFIAGATSSKDLKTVKAYQSALTTGAVTNAFVAELDSAGSTAQYVTYLGGSGTDAALGLAIDSTAQNIYVTGQTNSADFPIAPAAAPIQGTYGGSGDAFVAQLKPSAGTGSSQLILSTYLGGGGAEDTQGGAIALDGQGNAYVTGDTGVSSTTPFPTLNPYQPMIGGTSDVFVAKISPAAGTANFTINDFTISPGTISRGGSGTATVTVNSKNNFAGSVNLSCTVNSTNSGATLPACSLKPLSVVFAGNGSQQSTLTITTTKSGTSLFPSALWLPIPGIVLLGAGLTGGRSRRKLLGTAIMITVLAFLLALAGCGSSGSGGGGGGGGGGTSTGSYTVTVTGNALGASVTSNPASFSVD